MNWDDLKLLLAIGRAGSISGASRALNVHRATVLRRFDVMEARLGARLCDRTPEGYRLTAAGSVLFELAERTEADVRAAEARVAGENERVEGVVKVTMPEALATSLIAPRVAAFAARWPGLTLDLMATMDLMDLARRDADIAIRVAAEPSETLVGRRFGGVAQALYAAPDLAECWREQDPKPIIAWGGDTADWPLSFDIDAHEIAASSAEVSVQSAFARTGVGLACLPCFIADQDEGLIRVSERLVITEQEIWVLTHPDLRRQARIAAVMTFLTETLAAARPLIAGERPR